MPVTKAAINTAVTRLALHYKSSFPSEDYTLAMMVEYERCLDRIPWCEDDIFLMAVDDVIDHEQTRGFLPEWSLIRKRAWDLTTKKTAHSQADRAITDIRRRSALTVLPPPDDRETVDESTATAIFEQLFGDKKHGDRQEEGTTGS
jgi:hypothetical protein